MTYDGSGNVRQLVSAGTGTETARCEYEPFADPIRGTDPMSKENPLPMREHVVGQHNRSRLVRIPHVPPEPWGVAELGSKPRGWGKQSFQSQRR